jgi:hypothetical protein
VSSGLCADEQRARRATAGIAAPKFEPEEYDGRPRSDDQQQLHRPAVRVWRARRHRVRCRRVLHGCALCLLPWLLVRLCCARYAPPNPHACHTHTRTHTPCTHTHHLHAHARAQSHEASSYREEEVEQHTIPENGLEWVGEHLQSLDPDNLQGEAGRRWRLARRLLWCARVEALLATCAQRCGAMLARLLDVTAPLCCCRCCCCRRCCCRCCCCRRRGVPAATRARVCAHHHRGAQPLQRGRRAVRCGGRGRARPGARRLCCVLAGRRLHPPVAGPAAARAARPQRGAAHASSSSAGRRRANAGRQPAARRP